MHELHRAESIIKELRRRGLSGRLRVTISHLRQTFITLDEVRECFDLLCEDSEFRGSTIEFTPVDVVLRCRDCDNLITVSRRVPMSCERCHSDKLVMDGEDTLTIIRIEHWSS